MKNFSFTHNGEILWYSRSLACGMIVFKLNENNDSIISDVLINKRGQGCEFNKGKWNLPGGFIDFDEDGLDCAIRETKEECGIDLSKQECNFFKLNTKPIGHRQTMSAYYYTILTHEEAEKLKLTNKFADPGEVDEIIWASIRELDKYKLINNQKEIILSCKDYIYDNFI